MLRLLLLPLHGLPVVDPVRLQAQPHERADGEVHFVNTKNYDLNIK